VSADNDMKSELEDISVRLSVLERLCWHLSNAHEEDIDTANLEGVFHCLAEAIKREHLAIDGIVSEMMGRQTAAA
jgi:hypothetical protein